MTGGGGFLGTARSQDCCAGAACRSAASPGTRIRTWTSWASSRSGGTSPTRGPWRRAVEGCGAVFHTAAKAGLWGPEREYHRANVDGTRNIIDACRAAGVSRLIYTSSPSVVFNGSDLAGADESAPYSTRFEAAYPETKAIAEQLVLGGEFGRPGHGLAPAAPDLGARRQQPAAPDHRAGAQRAAPAHRPDQRPDRPGLHRQRRRGPRAGRRPPRAGFAR